MRGILEPQPPTPDGFRYDVSGCSCHANVYRAHEDPDCPLHWRNAGIAMGTEPTLINGRPDWELLLPPHRAARPEWSYWEATRLAAMYAVIKPGDVVYDVGAEEGDFPALWALWGASVVLAEPNPRVWPNIELVWRANGLPKPLVMFPGFFGSPSDAMAPNVAPWPVGSIHDWPACAYGPVIGDHGFCQVWERPDIPRTTIDRICREGTKTPPPNVITMDVEGSELHVLQGAEQTLLTHRPTVFVSIHRDFMREQYGQTPEELEAFMVTVGYEGEHLATDHERHMRYSSPLP